MTITTKLLRTVWLLATPFLFFTLTLTFTSATITTTDTTPLIRRDEHNIVIPLTYEPISNLLTATMSIGHPAASTYNLIVDTGSPFLVLQDASFHKQPSTWDPFGPKQPDIGDGGYITTDKEPNGKKGPVKPKMHFVTDTAWLNEASGIRAGAGAKAGNLTVGLTQLDDLKGAQGILGLSPPFDKLGSVQPGGGGAGGGGGGGGGDAGGKRKRHASEAKKPPPSSSEGGGKGGGGDHLPSLDVSFLHSYLSPDHRKTLSITGSSHFYLNFAASTTTSLPTGELVFPLSGTTLPTNIPGFSFDKTILIDPSTGSTYPKHPFWGIAHNPNLQFYLDGTILPDIKIDAILFDSGTSGIVAPPSEVSKIFSAANGKIATSSAKDSGAVLGKAGCGEEIGMGIDFGGKRAGFGAIRRVIDQKDGGFKETRHNDGGDQGWVRRGVGDGLMQWKSYLDKGVEGYVKRVEGLVGGIADWLHLQIPVGGGGGYGYGGTLGAGRKKKRHLNTHHRHHHKQEKRTLTIGVNLLNGANANDQNPPNPVDKPPQPQPQPQPQTQQSQSQPLSKESNDKKCEITLMGSPQVETMFPSPDPSSPLKVWILGIEFFQNNLVYHNIDTFITAIVPRTET
ncbi:uncharacterized protein UTRI_06513_B [Ustilago trichophora]|uniref:Uncharacterized protein n=1 Tax=Ustilago trichophora TaxID=86804 RepID=A0A5C3ENV3_9BASI|nr:uncharacterized protein UTRI_06513_B [Ustilago trichophora]